MEPTFKLSALGIRPDQDPQTVRTQLQAFLKGDPTAFEATFHRLSLNQPVVLGEGIPQAKAERLLEKFTALGLDCRLDPMTLSLIPMEETGQAAFYQCPACGHRQAPATNNQPDICERCGVVGRNYAATSELKQALELERRRVKTLMGHEEEAEEREKARQRQEKLRAIAKRQVEKEMGITSADKLKALFKPGAPLPVIGGMAAAAIGIGLLVWQLQNENRRRSTMPAPAPAPAPIPTPAPAPKWANPLACNSRSTRPTRFSRWKAPSRHRRKRVRTVPLQARARARRPLEMKRFLTLPE